MIKHRIPHLHASVPRLQEPRFYDDNRPKTPTGRHERTPLCRVYLDLENTTEDERAYTRAQVEMIARRPQGWDFAAVASQLPAERRVDIRPDTSSATSYYLPVPDPSQRENGIFITEQDIHIVKASRYPITGADGIMRPGSGTSGIIHHNPHTVTTPQIDPVQGDVVAQDIQHVSQNLDLRPGAAMLRHELEHFLQDASGTTPSDNDLVENIAITKENELLASWGLPPRGAHDVLLINHTPVPAQPAGQEGPNDRLY